jgi:hypothetical protein
VAGEPAEAMAAARAFVDAPDGIGSKTSYATEVALPATGTWRNPGVGCAWADIVLTAPEVGLPLLFIEADDCTEDASVIALKFDKYMRHFHRKVKDTGGQDKPMWRTRWSAPDPQWGDATQPPVLLVFNQVSKRPALKQTVEIDRTMSYARLVAKLERYDAYRNAPPSGRGNAARTPRSHWQETYAGPSLERTFPPVLFVFAPAPRRADPATREAAFHDRARRVGSVNYRLTVATTTLPLLTRHGADGPVWRVVGNGRGEDRCSLAALPKAR